MVDHYTVTHKVIQSLTCETVYLGLISIIAAPIENTLKYAVVITMQLWSLLNT
jgi:hypothetical protein